MKCCGRPTTDVYGKDENGEKFVVCICTRCGRRRMKDLPIRTHDQQEAAYGPNFIPKNIDRNSVWTGQNLQNVV